MRYAISLYKVVFHSPAASLLAVILLAATSLAAWKVWPWVTKTSNRRTTEARLAFSVVFGFGLLDWALLAALPWLGLSYGPVASSLAAITLVRLGGLCLAACSALALKVLPRKEAQPAARYSPFLLALLALNAGILVIEFYGMYLEPFNLGVSKIAVQSAAFLPDRPLRIVHLSDIHVERITKREQEMLVMVQELQPDLIVLTGDYLNIDHVNEPLTQEHAAQALSQLTAPYGVYAVLAPGVDQPAAMQRVFGSLENITLLQDETRRIDFPGAPLYLIGVTTRSIPNDSAVLHDLAAQIPSEAYTLLLYHKPDLAYVAAQEKVDLYLAGHTHGGQIRLPFYGAVITFSAFGKTFEMGRYQIDQTTLYVSRGIGMEGLNLPRARLLCPPEIVLLDLGGEAQP